MPRTIVEDRVLAHVSLEAVGCSDLTDAGKDVDHALGQAFATLGMLGIDVTPEITQTVRADIALILADLSQVARARSCMA